MGGSLSIKSVLPALFPNDPQFDYHNLSGGVQNRGKSMTIFPKGYVRAAKNTGS
ncbi:MAG: hypothetical protein MJZ33_08755 [Paludibacteraceae bacterium]|nr:hypothetical protein [Paludibacteraceae bacterium]